MFDLSFGKLAIIFALCLIVLGPEKLPKLAQQLGRWTGQARAMARHFRSQLEQEIASEELLKQKKDLEQRLTEPFKSTQDALHSATSEISGVTDAMNDTVNRVIESASPMPHSTTSSATSAADVPAVDMDTAHSDTDIGNPAHYIESDRAHIAAQTLAEAHVVTPQPVPDVIAQTQISSPLPASDQPPEQPSGEQPDPASGNQASGNQQPAAHAAQ